jgi:hypothetical protein
MSRRLGMVGSQRNLDQPQTLTRPRAQLPHRKWLIQFNCENLTPFNRGIRPASRQLSLRYPSRVRSASEAKQRFTSDLVCASFMGLLREPDIQELYSLHIQAHFVSTPVAAKTSSN